MMVLGQYTTVLVGTWWYWVIRRRYWLTLWYWDSIEQYWLIYDGTGSVWVNTCWYLVVLDQYRAVVVDTRWY